MNNEAIIAQIRELGSSPVPTGKEAFFRELEKKALPRRQGIVMSHGEFLAGQLLYIEKWIWLASGLLLLLLVWLCRRSPGSNPFALTPLLAAGILLETERSRRHRMDELEYAARFSLRSIVFARMFLVGLVDTVGLLVVIAVVGSYFPYALPRVFLYMMVPYLTAAFLGSVYERKMRTETGFGSLIICVLSSVAFVAAPLLFRQLYEEGLTILWAVALIALTCGLAVSMRQHMYEMEEPVWN